MARALWNPVTGAFDLLMAPFDGHADAALATVSILFGAAAMLIVKATSDQAGIRRTRGRLVAHVLEMRIYRDDLVLIVRALAAALATNLRYLRLIAWPTLLIAALVGALFMQLDGRFAHSRLGAREVALVTVTCRPGLDVMTAPIDLEAGEGAVVDRARVRVPARREVSWQVRAERPGTPAVTLRVAEATYRFALAAGPGTGLVGVVRSRSALSGVLHPGLPPLPGGPIERVDVRYPSARYGLFGWRAHWLAVFITWSLVGALVPKLLLRIEV